MRRFLTVLLIGIFVFAGVSWAIAEDKKTSAEERKREIEKTLFIVSGIQNRVLEIGLVDCIAYTLKSNSEIKIKRIEPKIKECGVKIANADFEPVISLDVSVDDSKERPTSSLSASKTKTQDFDVGIEGKLATGTEYRVEFLNQKYKSNSSLQNPNPYYKANPVITITQPLFRDFGTLVNTADITISRNNRIQSEESFKDTVMETISKAKAVFYAYMFSLENYTIAQSSLNRAKDLLEINKARYEKGLVSSVDLLEAGASVAQREKLLISSESSLKKAEDELKLITNLVDDPETWNAKLKLINDRPQFNETKIDLLASLKNAFSFRPDYAIAKIDLKNHNIKIASAVNELLPTVDVVTSLGLNGLGQDYQDALEKTASNYKDWGVGLKVSVPWGGAQQAKFDQRSLEKAQAILSFQRLEQNIILEVRDKVREVDIYARQVKAAKLDLETEEKNYTAQKERYAAGQVSTHDMLDYQNKLAQAELDYIKALIDYNVALINLDKSEGLTLVKNNIILEE